MFTRAPGQRIVNQAWEVYKLRAEDSADELKSSDKFPPDWGKPPKIQTRDHRILPGGYGYGSSTLAEWIAEKMTSLGGFSPQWGPPPKFVVRDFVAWPFGYAGGSSGIRTWIEEKALAVFGVEPKEYERFVVNSGGSDPAFGAPDARQPAQTGAIGLRPGKFPPDWGQPPSIQTRDQRILPGGYGYGSSTLAAWIADKMTRFGGFSPQWGPPPQFVVRDFVPWPFGYDGGSSGIRTWIEGKAREIFEVTPKEYDSFVVSSGGKDPAFS